MSWLRRIRNTIWPARIDREIERELSFHLAERVDALQEEGLSPEEARRRARRQFGNVLLQAERTRDMDVSGAIDARLRDLRYAIRSLARTPAFTLTALLTLTLGIGANATVFSALDAVLLQPLAFPEGDRLMRFRQLRESGAELPIAPIRLEDWNRLNVTFDAITGYYMEDVSETSGDVPERVRRAWVSPRFVEVWGIPPVIGRGFTPDEHLQGGPDGVLISHRYWQRRLAGDPNVLSRSVRIGAVSVPIVGVMPATFYFPERDVDLWFPSATDYAIAQSRKNTWYTGVGRLKRGSTIADARTNLHAVQAQLALQFPDTDRDITVEIVPLKEQTLGRIGASLWLLFGAVSVLLLITCVNVAALLLSRATHRQQEVTLRMSLGASRSAVVAQVLTEAALLSITGGTIGVALAAAAGAWLRTLQANLPRVEEIALSGRVLVYTFVTSLVVALVCALLPALRAGRNGLAGGLKDAGRTQVSGRHTLQWTLVGVQVMLSVTLLVGAGLLTRSFRELSRVEAGFAPRPVTIFRISGDYGETMNFERLTRRIDTAINALLTVPGVTNAATAAALPGLPSQFDTSLVLAEGSRNADAQMVADARVVSPEYFSTLRIPIVGGELCRRVASGAERDVMINRAFAARYLTEWPSPIGLHLNRTSDGGLMGRISGIVGDAREQGLDRAPQPTIYRCISAPGPTPYFLVRTSVDSASTAQAIRLKVKQLEPLRSVYDTSPLSERIDSSFAENRLRTIVITLFAGAALLLACIGLFGTLSYVISLRRREIGLRFALGAARGAIVGQFLRGVLRVVGIGVICGLALSMMATRWIAGMLYGVSATDPWTIAGVAVAVLVIAGLAAVGPAARAALLDPVQVLREE